MMVYIIVCIVTDIPTPSITFSSNGQLLSGSLVNHYSLCWSTITFDMYCDSCGTLHTIRPIVSWTGDNDVPSSTNCECVKWKPVF